MNICSQCGKTKREQEHELCYRIDCWRQFRFGTDKGFIQKIIDGDNVHDVTPDEAARLKAASKLMESWTNFESPCHGATLNINSEGITCSYCGEPCEFPKD